ncbi:MAG: Na+/H+ antiporter NhaA [Pseudomonadales bacterium]|nr:Na+/H+ antiporter NhaA [Pseudomonadales bacterium]
MPNKLQSALKHESSSGVLLLGCALLAIICANSPLDHYYDALLATPVEIRIGELDIAKPLLLWINDGLMAIFFFHVGLELKREILAGELASPKRMVLPTAGAIGGMLFPALIYVAINIDDQVALQGWAIPAATDIAFALGVLALLGNRVPASLKIFLASLAVLDDIGAILIIAFFYTVSLSELSIAIAFSMVCVLFILNKLRVRQVAPYLLTGIVMWVAVLKSGVHATLAGVVLAMFMPLSVKGESGQPLLIEMEHSIRDTVALVILPLFAFANAGVSLTTGNGELFNSISLGIAAGLFFGKQIGVFLFCFIVIQLGMAALPSRCNWRHLFGVSALCGIGFTMSLFIGSLAFEHAGPDYTAVDRIGILTGSFCSALLGYGILRWWSGNIHKT